MINLDLIHYRALVSAELYKISDSTPFYAALDCERILYRTQVVAFWANGVEASRAARLLVQEHKGWGTWQDWNVALWIMNSQTSYRELFLAMEHSADLNTASDCFMSRIGADVLGYAHSGEGLLTTPDGAVYTARAVRELMEEYPELLGTKGKHGLWGDDWKEVPAVLLPIDDDDDDEHWLSRTGPGAW